MSFDENDSYDLNDSNFSVDINTYNDGHPYLHIDVLNRMMYHNFRKSSIESRKLLHIWPHWFLLTAIKNRDCNFFEEIIHDILQDISEEEESEPISVDFFNHILGDTYLNIVTRNGLSDFKSFLLPKGVNFNRTNESYNSFIHFVPKSDHVDMLAVFLEQETRNLKVKIEISLHVAVRRNDIICAYMLISKGACTDIFDDGDLRAFYFDAMTSNVDMVRLILAEELLNIDTQHNYHKIVQDILGKVYEYPINLNVVKNTAVIRGNHAVLRKLLKLQPKLINNLIMNAYQLLKKTSQEINTIADRLQYLQYLLTSGHECVDDSPKDVDNRMILGLLQVLSHLKEDQQFYYLKTTTTNMTVKYLQKLTLGHECEDVHCNDDEIMIFRMLQVQPHDKKDGDFNFFERNITVENYLPRLNYICILCCNWRRCCRLCCPMKRNYSLLPKRHGFGEGGNSVLVSRLMIFKFRKKLKYIRQRINRNYPNSGRYFINLVTRSHVVDFLASLLEEMTTIEDISFEGALNNVLHIAVRRNDLICTYMLLCKGASASDPNIYNMTALHLAARNGNVDMVRLILMVSQQPPDIDSYRDHNNQTTREVIQKLPELSFHSNFFEDLKIPPIQEQTLKFFLNNSDETKCLKVMKEGFFGELSLEVAEELLNIAMRRNYYKIVQEILGKTNKNPIKLNKSKRKAVLYGNHAILRVLFKLQPKVTYDLIFFACRRLIIWPEEIDNTSDRLECLKLILEQERVVVRCTDGLGNTPLHYALRASSYEAAILLLKRGSYLGHVNKSNNIVISNIPASVLSNYFNDCIQVKEEWTDECTIEFDYRCLMPHGELDEQYGTYQTTCEMEVILYIANNDTLKHLLKHPLLSSFLYIKWYRIRHVLYANFVFYMMFYFFLNAYVLNMTYTSKSVKQLANDSFDTVFANTLQSASSQGTFLRAFVMGMLLLFACREFLQFVFCPRRYMTDLKNWSQILLIVLTLILLCSEVFVIGVMVALLSTWELMTLICHHLLPSTSTTIEMFRTVLFNFVRFFFPYIFLILAFALAFHILFRNDSFSNPGLSLFKTIIMLTGEFDANNISFSAYPVFSRLVFVLFIFNIIIVLLNLLKGLAVDDIAKILNKAEIIGLISRIHLIIYFERMVIGKPFCWNSQWTWWNPFNFLSRKILLFPYFLRDGKISFKPYDNLVVYNSNIYFDDKSNESLQSIDYHKLWSTLKIDPNIIKSAKQVASNKNEPSNDDIMDEFAELLTRLTQIKLCLNKCYAE